MSHCLSSLLPNEKVTALVKSWLEEDTPSFDYAGYVVGENSSKAQLLIKSPGIVAGVPFFDAIFKEVNCETTWLVKEGDHIDGNTPTRIAIVNGKCKDILLGERVALNCLCRASGIATTARKYINQALQLGWSGKVAGTRKTTPGFRLVEKYAMLVAGADTHRYNLSSMVMLKDNHIWATGDISKAVKKVKNASGFSLKIEVECQSIDEGMEAAKSGADVVMFDNFSPEDIHKAAASLKLSYPHVIVEASGGIDESTFASFCGPNIDIVSTSKLTQSYSIVDFSLKILRD